MEAIVITSQCGHILNLFIRLGSAFICSVLSFIYFKLPIRDEKVALCCQWMMILNVDWPFQIHFMRLRQVFVFFKGKKNPVLFIHEQISHSMTVSVTLNPHSYFNNKCIFINQTFINKLCFRDPFICDYSKYSTASFNFFTVKYAIIQNIHVKKSLSLF